MNADSAKRMDIGFRYYNRIRNVGDAITPYVLEHLTGFQAASVTHELAHVLGIGSIFFMATPTSHIWGTGLLHPGTHVPNVHPERIYAVRGKATLEALRAKDIKVRDVPLGDPGIFAAELLSSSDLKSEPIYQAAIIPHHSDFNHPLYRQLRGSKEHCVINVLTDSLLAVRQIAQSKTVISQSLHGLIFAESLGKPSLWIATQDNAAWNFKFQDWFSTTSNPQIKPRPLSTHIDHMIKEAEPRLHIIDRTALIRALPIASTIHDLGKPLGFRQCRGFGPPSVPIAPLFGGACFGSFEELKKRASGSGVRAAEAFRAFFGHWSERTYLAMHPRDEDVPVSPRQVQIMAATLDQMIEADYAFIIARNKIAGRNLRLKEIRGGVSIVEESQCLGGALLVRPDFNGFTERFVTFVV